MCACVGEHTVACAHVCICMCVYVSMYVCACMHMCGGVCGVLSRSKGLKDTHLS